MKSIKYPVLIKGIPEQLSMIFETLVKEGKEDDWGWNKNKKGKEEYSYLLIRESHMEYHNHACRGDASSTISLEEFSIEETLQMLGILFYIYEIY